MRRLATALAALLLGTAPALSGSYTAAPVDPIVPMPPAAPAFNWTGGYVGLGLGHLRQRDTQFSPTRILAPASGAQLSALIGYNWQGAGAFVMGGEAMIAGGSVRGNEPCTNPTFDCATSVGTTAALRLRMGVAQDRTLFFITAGIARMAVTHSTELQPVPGLTSVNQNRNATTLGLGIEQAMTNGWNVRGEIEGYRLRQGTYILDSGLNYSAPSGRATAARLTLVRRF